MREGFLLDPRVVHLNHGSFGACPVPVFEEYQAIQRELEAGPTDFFARKAARWFWGSEERPGRLAEARASLAAFVGAQPEDLVFVSNATSGLNAVIRSLRLEPGDRGADDRARVRRYHAHLGVCGRQPRRVRAGRDRRADGTAHAGDSRLAHHLADGARVPGVEICAAARAASVLSIVDGAHAPGQVPLDLDALDADIYAGNCHKWLCAPKGVGFLWARPEQQSWIEPLVVSWGCRDGADFAERHGWAGTRDPAAYLTVPKAIEVHATFDLERARPLADDVGRRLGELGCPRVAGVPAPFMRAVELPPGDPDELWGTSLPGVPESRLPCTSGTLGGCCGYP